MVSYLGAIWRSRYFWISLVKNDLRTRYRRSLLGMGWSLLHPIAMTVILCLVFAKIMNPAGGVRSYAPFLLAGLACWDFIRNVTLQGCQSFFQGESYIRQYPAPMAIYPLRTALGATIHLLIALGVVLVLAAFVHFTNPPPLPGQPPYAVTYVSAAALLSLVPSIVLIFLLGWSLAVLAGFANVFFRDTQHLSEVGFQILFYATPIIYPAEVLRSKNLSWIADYNPLVAFLDLIRHPILTGQLPTAGMYQTALWTVLVTGCLASWALYRFQRRLIFQL
jgi:lipopolysaccharide transport system permease protein